MQQSGNARQRHAPDENLALQDINTSGTTVLRLAALVPFARTARIFPAADAAAKADDSPCPP